MKGTKGKEKRSLKWKMIFFKLHFIFIYIVYRPRRFFINKSAKQNYYKSKKPLIIAYNHVGFYDGLTIWNAFILRNIRFIAMEEMDTNPFRRFFFNWNGLILVDRESFTVNKFRTIINAVNSGYSLGIAPEGVINREIALKPFQLGTAKIAKFTKTNILPIYFVPHRKLFFKNQHIHIGNIIDISLFNSAEDLTSAMKEAMEKLRYNAFFKQKSYVYIIPVDYNINPENVKFKFYQKQTKDSNYYAQQTAWYHLDLILRKQFGLNLSLQDLMVGSDGRVTHPSIKFDISYTDEIIAIIISSNECRVNIQKDSTDQVKENLQEEVLLDKNLIKTKKIKHNKQTYILTANVSGKLYINKRIVNS